MSSEGPTPLDSTDPAPANGERIKVHDWPAPDLPISTPITDDTPVVRYMKLETYLLLLLGDQIFIPTVKLLQQADGSEGLVPFLRGWPNEILSILRQHEEWLLKEAKNHDLTSIADENVRQQYKDALIVALVRRARPELSLDELRSRLDRTPCAFDSVEPLLLPDAVVHPTQRLARARPEIVGSPFSPMSAPEGMMISWSPLVHLGTNDTFALDQRRADGDFPPMIMPLSGSEIVCLEGKDIARDFIAQLHLHWQPVAGLATGIKAHESVDREAATCRLLRERDLATVALRLAGFTAFHDPELLGSYVYDGLIRYRLPTVFRQTLLLMLRNEPKERIGTADVARITTAWSLLASYDATARHLAIDRVLTMFRRVFDRRFLPVVARAGLLFSTLEAMLGRFRSPKEPVQLEDLVAKLTGADSPAAMWFIREGRRFRNRVAHGAWIPNQEGSEPLEHLTEVLRATVPIFVRIWGSLNDRTNKTPSRALIDQVAR